MYYKKNLMAKLFTLCVNDGTCLKRRKCRISEYQFSLKWKKNNTSELGLYNIGYFTMSNLNLKLLKLRQTVRLPQMEW